MRRLLTIVCVALTFTTTICFAHRDTVLKIDAGGRFDGLPPEYNPASLRVDFSRSSESGEPPISSLELKVGGKTIVVPECVTGLILTRSMKDVRVIASWYHDTSLLPPYLEVTLYDPGHEKTPYRPGYSLFFNLSTAKLFKMDVIILRDDSSTQIVPVDISERCSVPQLQEFAERRLRPNTSLERTRGE